MPGTFSRPLRASDPDMHQGTCVTHAPWCMLGSLTSCFLWIRWRIRQEAHCLVRQVPMSNNNLLLTWFHHSKRARTGWGHEKESIMRSFLNLMLAWKKTVEQTIVFMRFQTSRRLCGGIITGNTASTEYAITHLRDLATLCVTGVESSFFGVNLNKLLNKQSLYWWFKTAL